MRSVVSKQSLVIKVVVNFYKLCQIVSSTYLYMCVWGGVYIYIYIYICVCVCVNVCVCVWVYFNIYIYIYIYIYIAPKILIDTLQKLLTSVDFKCILGRTF